MKIISMLAGFALVGSLCTGAIPAQASDFDKVSIRVPISDLDLNTGAGAKTAMSRIRGAAREVCGPDPDFRDLDSRRTFDHCVTDAVDHAVESLDMPAVTAANAHNERPVRVAASSR